ncbi:hypothetical protein O9G_003465 [Rozella allomycis CSF55]|uniref:Uncharacterized protein n=1 Tax=Rozella allomycis (strain CSF55) TaxID=988480 RepID=A0A075AUV5_ROZAC|nr:hypothetical protein O9G_003465 [Rozella allomycis CSF55]|eukprot:EPZ33945.1 hypothetical protein O9G_003465 [Rozella allomycis CSF55]
MKLPGFLNALSLLFYTSKIEQDVRPTEQIQAFPPTSHEMYQPNDQIWLEPQTFQVYQNFEQESFVNLWKSAFYGFEEYLKQGAIGFPDLAPDFGDLAAEFREYRELVGTMKKLVVEESVDVLDRLDGSKGILIDGVAIEILQHHRNEKLPMGQAYFEGEHWIANRYMAVMEFAAGGLRGMAENSVFPQLSKSLKQQAMLIVRIKYRLDASKDNNAGEMINNVIETLKQVEEIHNIAYKAYEETIETLSVLAGDEKFDSAVDLYSVEKIESAIDMLAGLRRVVDTFTNFVIAITE